MIFSKFHFCCLFLNMGLVYLRELDADSKFAIWKIEETADELLSFLQLNDVESHTLKTLNKGKRTLHWLATRVLLRQLLQTEEYIQCVPDPNGKPYLPDYPLQISLTHSFDYAGAMLSNRGACGIDLELVKDKIERIREKFLRPEELAFIPATLNRIEQLYACWCAKEAVYKLQGNKGTSFYHNMTILPFEYTPQGVMQVRLDAHGTSQLFDVYYERFNDYMLGYVVGS